MQVTRVKIETANLERGMYVAQLDRPWLETPFLFQGFQIRDDKELKLLRQFCKHVYIDIGRSNVPKEKLLTATRVADVWDAPEKKPRPGHQTTVADRMMQVLGRIDPTGTVQGHLNNQRYRNTVPTRKEAPQAIRAYDAAVEAVTDVLAEIRNGAGVDAERVQGAVKPMIESVLRNQDAMAWLVYLRKRDEYTYHHSIATSVWAMILGRHLGFDRQGLDSLAMGGMLLDVGKAKIPEALTNKPGPLSSAEREIMQQHVADGLEMVRLTPGINADVIAMIEGHHERHDGSGYPRGLKGGDIPVYARIAGVVDCYDAMISHRPWAQGKSPYAAIRELNSLSGTKFQKDIVEQFVQALGMFPTGSLVELNTGEVGIVVEQNRIRRLRPKLMLVLDVDKQPLREYRTVDLRQLPAAQGESGAMWIISGHESGAFGIDPKNYFIG